MSFHDNNPPPGTISPPENRTPESTDGARRRPRQLFSRVIFRQLRESSLQDLLSNLEPMLRSVVGLFLEPMLRSVVRQEMDRAMARILPAARPWQNNQITEPPARTLRLQFITKPTQSVFTQSKLEGENDSTIGVRLLDVNCGLPVTTGPESEVKLDVVPLMGDFNIPDDDDWSAEVFETNVVKERDGKGSLLIGDRNVILKEGLGTLGNLRFTDNSSWTRSKTFRLGVRVAAGYGEGIRIREAKTHPFQVKDNRGSGYRKHDTPALEDEVWRLKNIRKDGKYHKRLNEDGILTVRDFLKRYRTNPDQLKNVLKMAAEKYKNTAEHAQNCVLGSRFYTYSVNHPPYEALLFNERYETVGLIESNKFVRIESVPRVEMVRVDALIKSAYEHWETGVCITEAPFTNSDVVPEPSSQVPAIIAGSKPPKDLDANLGFLQRGTHLQQELKGSSSIAVNSEVGDANLPIGFTEGDMQGSIRGQVEAVTREIDMSDIDEIFALASPFAREEQRGGGWLKIRTLIRCAIFMRSAAAASASASSSASAAAPPPPHYQI